MLLQSRSDSAKAKKSFLFVSLCHILIQAGGKQSYNSPLLLSIGLFVPQSTRSRVLINVLSSFYLSVSYSQVLAFQRSAVVSHIINDLTPGLVPQNICHGFCHWVADTGQDTTHAIELYLVRLQRMQMKERHLSYDEM